MVPALTLMLSPSGAPHHLMLLRRIEALPPWRPMQSSTVPMQVLSVKMVCV